jgi:hypothetical protein
MVMAMAKKLTDTSNGLLAQLFRDFLKEYLEANNRDIQRPRALEEMSHILYAYYDKRIIVLIDECDTPMHSAIEHNYAEKVCFILLLYRVKYLIL